MSTKNYVNTLIHRHCVNDAHVRTASIPYIGTRTRSIDIYGHAIQTNTNEHILENRLIHEYGTLTPHGINVVFALTS